MTEVAPLLPPELERVIFEFGAQLHPGAILIFAHPRGGSESPVTHVSVKAAEFILSKCPKLHCELSLIFGHKKPRNFKLPLFSKITHLEIFDTPTVREIDPEEWSKLAHIPNLTHLAFNEEGFAPVARVLLETCISLQVLVILLFQPDTVDEVALRDDDAAWEGLAYEVRFVVMTSSDYIKDWNTGARTGVDFWSRAEDIVESRKLGNIWCVTCCVAH
ncbi:hypothetical protein B0H16DRAFT_1718844 [Mycena metata]|uniref:Uncharacterized protein n=1 Tax=Mycena metata TaxID=1033252 RepID=A0AAD7JGM3_9AGAR|nr:hypothetical protein B0H16DRAFT_1718844 [Mycena metata]